MRAISLPSSAFINGNAWDGVGFDGSSVGFSKVEKSDMHLVPDPDSLMPDPFHDEPTGMLMAGIATADGLRFCPRSKLHNILARYEKLGIQPLMSPEMEFYVFKNMEEAVLENDLMGSDLDWASKNIVFSILDYHRRPEYQLRPKEAYLASLPSDELSKYRARLSSLLQDVGYHVKYHHHEGGRRQIEIETGYTGAIDSADYIVNFKYLAKNLAKEFGLLPTFMPKPSTHDAGNGLHFHIKVMRGDENAFDGGDGLSDLALNFIAGLLDHASALCSFTNPTINSYRRLMPGFEAPVVIAWSSSNRSALIRVPSNAKGRNANMEIRNPDPSCNPYLASTVILAAGLDGIKRKLQPPEEKEGNLYESNDLDTLPATLEEALAASERDEVIISAIGKHTFENFKTIKMDEINAYRKHVPVWDFNMYFGI